MVLLSRVVEEIQEQFRLRSVADGIELTCHTPAQPISLALSRSIIHDVTLLFEHLFSFLPAGSILTLGYEERVHDGYIHITGTGINLSAYTGVLAGCELAVIIASTAAEELTRYEIKLAEQVKGKTEKSSENNFYLEIQDRLRSHFNKEARVMERLRESPREAAFMARVNAVINNHVSDTKFDVNKLADTMNLSRTQLFRKLKPIIGQSAAGYIRSLRLQKAKELLETTELRVSEVAFLTGFETPSHFTKVFAKAFGIRPSVIARNQHAETNES